MPFPVAVGRPKVVATDVDAPLAIYSPYLIKLIGNPSATYLVTWNRVNYNATLGVFVNASLQPVGSPFTIGTGVAIDRIVPTFDGGFATVVSAYNIGALYRHDTTGAAVAGPYDISSQPANAFDIAALSNGNIVAAGGDSFFGTSSLRLLSPSLDLLTTLDFSVGSPMSFFRTVALPAGGFVLAGSTYGASTRTHFRCFTNAGVATSAVISLGAPYNQVEDIAAADDGGFYLLTRQDGTADYVLFKYTAAGTVVSGYPIVQDTGFPVGGNRNFPMGTGDGVFRQCVTSSGNVYTVGFGHWTVSNTSPKLGVQGYAADGSLDGQVVDATYTAMVGGYDISGANLGNNYGIVYIGTNGFELGGEPSLCVNVYTPGTAPTSVYEPARIGPNSVVDSGFQLYAYTPRGAHGSAALIDDPSNGYEFSVQFIDKDALPEPPSAIIPTNVTKWRMVMNGLMDGGVVVAYPDYYIENGEIGFHRVSPTKVVTSVVTYTEMDSNRWIDTPVVVPKPNGQFIIAWQNGFNDSYNGEIRYRMYNANGAAGTVKTAAAIPDWADGLQGVALTGGEVVFAWFDPNVLKFCMVDSSGEPMVAPTTVATAPGSYGSWMLLEVVRLSNGGFRIVWNAAGTTGGARLAFQRDYDATGTPTSDVIEIVQRDKFVTGPDGVVYATGVQQPNTGAFNNIHMFRFAAPNGDVTMGPPVDTSPGFFDSGMNHAVRTIMRLNDDRIALFFVRRNTTTFNDEGFVTYFGPAPDDPVPAVSVRVFWIN